MGAVCSGDKATGAGAVPLRLCPCCGPPPASANKRGRKKSRAGRKRSRKRSSRRKSTTITQGGEPPAVADDGNGAPADATAGGAPAESADAGDKKEADGDGTSPPDDAAQQDAADGDGEQADANAAAVDQPIVVEKPDIRIVDTAAKRLVTEPVRLVLNYADYPYTEDIVTAEQLAALCDEHNVTSAPVVFVGGKPVADPIAAARFVVLDFEPRLAGDDAWENARMDMLLEAYAELRRDAAKVLASGADHEWDDYKAGRLRTALDALSNTVLESGHGWLVGQRASWADLVVGDLLAALRTTRDRDLLRPWPNLEALAANVRKTPQLAHYFARRTMPKWT